MHQSLLIATRLRCREWIKVAGATDGQTNDGGNKLMILVVRSREELWG